MKITAGVFPWKHLYLGLFALLLALVGYWSLTGSAGRSLGGELPLCFAIFSAWWSFLTFKSGVAPSRFGNRHSRAKNPIAFWLEIIFLVGLSVVFTMMAIFW